MHGKYDIDEIKSRLSISDLFTRDSRILKRIGNTLVTHCPFHEERTPSCQVDDHNSSYHCYGCGAHGDIFDYWQQTRGVDFKTALEQIAGILGMSATDYADTPPPQPKYHATKVKTQKTEQPPKALDGSDLEKWQQANKKLSDCLKYQRKIAKWRGYSKSVISWACREGLIGLYDYYNTQRVALLVQMPQEGKLIPVASHIRLAPNSQGNPHAKQSWRFYPSGCGAWPFIYGDHEQAKYLFITEGQWDALALIDLMGWHKKTTWPDSLCVIGLRGASSGEKLIANYKLRKDAIAFAFADADQAGSNWFFQPCFKCPSHPKNQEADNPEVDCTRCEARKPSFIEQLQKKIKIIHGLQPQEAGNDLNDIIRSGELTRSNLLEFIKSKVPDHKAKPTGLTIFQYCRKIKDSETSPEIKQAIEHIMNDPTRPLKRKNLAWWVKHWERQELPPDKLQNLRTLWQEYATHEQIT